MIFLIGPQDDKCSFTASQVQEDCKGLLIDFVVAPHAGTLFLILFQFWFTLFLLAFITEDCVLYACLRNMQTSTSLPLRDLILRFVGLTVFYLGLSFWAGGYTPLRVWSLYVSAMDSIFTFCLLRGVAASRSRQPSARAWQYAAAACAVAQFCIPPFFEDQPTGFDGRIVIYYHLFRQFIALGFTSTLTRTKVKPICSRAWPVVVILLLAGCPSTNFFRSGQLTYPWFPFIPDRILYTSGSFVVMFIMDRIGNVFAELGLCVQLPNSIGTGTLLAYMFHPLGIVFLSKVPHLFDHVDPLFVAILILTLFTGIVLIASIAKG
jgi:hypothetical protein